MELSEEFKQWLKEKSSNNEINTETLQKHILENNIYKNLDTISGFKVLRSGVQGDWDVDNEEYFALEVDESTYKYKAIGSKLKEDKNSYVIEDGFFSGKFFFLVRQLG